MQPSQAASRLQTTFDVHQYRLSAAEEELLRGNLGGLARQVEHFPVADLHVLIEGNARSTDVSVKLTLVLPGTVLVANDHDAVPQPAFERSLNSLIDSLQAYKERLGRVSERQKVQKGTRQEFHTPVILDTAALGAAVEAGDYPAFRGATLPLEEGLRKLAGRWVQRYPELDAQIDHAVKIDDVVEDVFLLAFEGYKARPADVPLGTWLQHLIDPAVKALQQHRDAELENIELARSARAAAQGSNNA